MFSKLFPKKSVTSILGAFHKLSDDLRTLAAAKTEEARLKDAKISDLMVEVEDAEAEAAAALDAAANIEKLVGTAEEAF